MNGSPIRAQERRLQAAQARRSNLARTLATDANVSSKSRIWKDPSIAGEAPKRRSESPNLGRSNRLMCFLAAPDVSTLRSSSRSCTPEQERRNRGEKNFSNLFGRPSPERRDSVRRTDYHETATSTSLDPKAEIAARNADRWKGSEHSSVSTRARIRKNMSSNAVVPRPQPDRRATVPAARDEAFEQERVCRKSAIIMDISAEVARRVAEAKNDRHQRKQSPAERRHKEMASCQMRAITGSPPRIWDGGKAAQHSPRMAPTRLERLSLVATQAGLQSPRAGSQDGIEHSGWGRRTPGRVRPPLEDGRSWWHEGGASPVRVPGLANRDSARRVSPDLRASPWRGRTSSPTPRGSVTPPTSDCGAVSPRTPASPSLFDRCGQDTPCESTPRRDAASPARPLARTQGADNFQGALTPRTFGSLGSAAPTNGQPQLPFCATPRRKNGYAVSPPPSKPPSSPSPRPSNSMFVFGAASPARQESDRSAHASKNSADGSTSTTRRTSLRTTRLFDDSRPDSARSESARARYVNSVLLSSNF